MKGPKLQQKPDGTLQTDFYRLIYCGMGCFFIGFGFTKYLDEEQHWPLFATLGSVVLGLALVGFGLFAKAKTIKKNPP